MRKVTPNLVRLLVVLAMVCGLVAIVAAPAAADIWDVTIVASPCTANTEAGYTIEFYADNCLLAGEQVVITFPEEMQFPSTTIDGDTIFINGVSSSDALVTPNAEARTLTVALNDDQEAEWLCDDWNVITIASGAHFKNPKIAHTVATEEYAVTVTTSQDPDPADGNPGYLGVTPSYTVSPLTGNRNTEITVAGKGWTPDLGVSIYDEDDNLLGYTTANSDGVFSVKVKALTTGEILVVDGALQWGAGGTGEDSDGNTWDCALPGPFIFNVGAALSLSRTSVNECATVTITGTDFTEDASIPQNGITIGGVIVGPPAAMPLNGIDQWGDDDDFVFQAAIPAGMPVTGAVEVKATDNAGTPRTAVAKLTILAPRLVITPPTGQPNDWVTVEGFNFCSSDIIWEDDIEFQGVGWNGDDVQIDGQGHWQAILQVPDDAFRGSNTVMAWSDEGTFAQTTFVVGARALTLTPAEGPKGTRVWVSADNMGRCDDNFIDVDADYLVGDGGLWFDPQPGYETWNEDEIAIDSQGNLETTRLIVPAEQDGDPVAIGPHTVIATDECDPAITATGTFTITEPTLSLSAEEGYMGDTIYVSGEGWLPQGVPGNVVLITFNGDVFTTGNPGPDGKFRVSLEIPLTDQIVNQVGAWDNLENEAPPELFRIGEPMIKLTPEEGAIGDPIEVQGYGFNPQSALWALTIEGANILPHDPVTTSITGYFETEFIVPGLAAGPHNVVAAVAGTEDEVSQLFKVVAAPEKIENQLASCMDKIVILWSWNDTDDEWTWYNPENPVNTIDSLASHQGFWIYMEQACQLTYKDVDMQLGEGWNQKGW